MRLAIVLALVLASAVHAAPTAPKTVTLQVVLTVEQLADAQAVVAMARLQGAEVTVAQVVQDAVDQRLKTVRAESLKARAAKRITDAALAAYHKRLDAELDEAEKKAKP